jgi:phage terminase large subunit-like protein
MSQTQRIKPFREQRRFCTDDKRYYGYISGVGAGKTYAGIIRTIRNLTEWNPGEMGAIVAPTRQMIVNVIIPEMRDLGLFDDPINWEYKSAYSDEPGIHTPEGSRALILSADNQRTIERLRGLNLAWGWVDEESVVDPRAREILMQRLRAGEYRNMYITTTPKGRNHTYDFFVGDVDATQKQFGRATLYETPDRLAITGVPTDANPHTPDDYKAAMEKDMAEDIRAQEVEGQFVEIGSGIYSRETFTFIHADDIDDSYRLRYVVGVDPAVQADSARAERTDSDYWAATLCAIHRPQNRLFAVDTKRQRGMTLTEGAEWVAQIARTAGADILVEATQAQRWLAQELRDYNVGVTQVQTTREKEQKLIGMSIPLENNVVQFVNHDVDTTLGYDPRWQPLIQEALAFPEGSHDDLLDSLHIVLENANLNAGTVLGTDLYGREDGDDEER